MNNRSAPNSKRSRSGLIVRICEHLNTAPSLGRARRIIRCVWDTSTGAAGAFARGRRYKGDDPPHVGTKSTYLQSRKRATTATTRRIQNGYPSDVPSGTCKKVYKFAVTAVSGTINCLPLNKLAQGVSSKKSFRPKRSGLHPQQHIHCQVGTLSHIRGRCRRRKKD